MGGSHVLAILMISVGTLLIAFAGQIQIWWLKGARQDGMPFQEERQAVAESAVAVWTSRVFGLFFILAALGVFTGILR